MVNDGPRLAGISYIPTLDGWRAIAIAAVLFCHGLDQRTHPYAVQLGYAGVLLFFAISGFLITSRLIEETALTGTTSLRGFYIRRAFRILPPALLFLATVAVLGLAGAIPFSLSDILKSLFFVRNYTFSGYADPATWFSAHFWSLSVEEHFYLIWPTIFVLAGLKRLRWVTPALAVATIAWRTWDQKYDVAARAFHAPNLTNNLGRSDYLADVLLWGCALALWLGPRPWKSRLPHEVTSLVGGMFLMFIYLAFFTSRVGHAGNFVHLSMALLVGCTVTGPGSALGRFLEWAPLRFIGRLSYSLYLWQQLFFHEEMKALWFQRFPLNVALIFGCACLSYYFVERPMVRLGHRFARPPKLGHADDLEDAKEAAA